MKTLVIISSVRNARFADTVAAWALDRLRQTPGLDITVADFKDIPLPFYNDERTPSMINGDYHDPAVKSWVELIASHDAFVVITPEYNRSIPGVLKNALDWVHAGAWINKPVGNITYGGISGGVRASEHLNQIYLELGLRPVFHHMHIQYAREAFDEAGRLKNPRLVQRMEDLVADLEAAQAPVSLIR